MARHDHHCPECQEDYWCPYDESCEEGEEEEYLICEDCDPLNYGGGNLDG